MTLQDKLQYLRKKNGYSQEQLADKLCIARQTVSKWENGQAIPELSGRHFFTKWTQISYIITKCTISAKKICEIL